MICTKVRSSTAQMNSKNPVGMKDSVLMKNPVLTKNLAVPRVRVRKTSAQETMHLTAPGGTALMLLHQAALHQTLHQTPTSTTNHSQQVAGGPTFVAAQRDELRVEVQ